MNKNINKIISTLEANYSARGFHIASDPVDLLVETILSQNTNDVNRDKASANLHWEFRGGWEKVLRASEAKIASLIRIGGLHKIKAARIKEVLKEVKKKNWKETGKPKISLEHLRKMSLNDARKWLMELKGIGPKTAAIVLLFGLGKPAFPVDTHIFRVSKRLGLIPEKTSYEKAHELLEQMVPEGKRASVHVKIIEHGRKVCKAARPRCGVCPLSKECKYYENVFKPALPKI